jgi:NAD(P)-dependent dehydrogenase (short-subunit alcohol dehydrogenase family)
MSFPRRLEGKVAIVTGGASGIGAATSRRLAAEGAKVAVADLNGVRASALASEIGAAAIPVQFDAQDVVSIKRLVEETVAEFGRLDILHNNAALMDPTAIANDTNPVDIDFAVWDRTMEVNLRGYLAGCKYAIPHMIAVGGGAIVLTASGSGTMGDMSNVAYGTSKSAILGLNRYVATIYGSQGIRCNAINPGLIRTEGGKGNVPDEMLPIMQRNTLVPRLGVADDIAAAVAFLVSDDAAFITGTSLDVDGGMLCHAPYMSDFLEAYGAGQAFGSEAKSA